MSKGLAPVIDLCIRSADIVLDDAALQAEKFRHQFEDLECYSREISEQQYFNLVRIRRELMELSALGVSDCVIQELYRLLPDID